MKKLYTLLLITAVVASCKKTVSEEIIPDNIVTLEAKAEIGLNISTQVWKSIVINDKGMVDSAFVSMMYDVYDGSNNIRYSVVDTVIIPAYHGGINFKYSSYTTQSTWTAKNIKILKAWSTGNKYRFTY